MFELMVLAKLMYRPCHGYELKSYLSRYNPNNNKIYPTLRQLNEKGFVDVQIQVQQNRPNRKIYSITEAGQRWFVHLLEDFDATTAQSIDAFNLRIYFSHLLDRSSMQRILKLRKEAMQQQAQIPQLLPLEENRPHAEALQALYQQIQKLELDFIDRLEQEYA